MATGASEKPRFIADEHLDYLDELFESYAMDVRRAYPMLCAAFRLEEPEAKETVAFWVKTFGRRLSR